MRMIRIPGKTHTTDVPLFRTMPADLQEQLLNAIQKVFNYNRRQAENVYVELIVCMKKRQYITIYRMDDDDSAEQEDVDQAILRTLLR